MQSAPTRRTLHLIGYWAGPGEEDWPDPAAFVDADGDRERQARISDYLRHGTAVVVAAGFSPCRLCGRPNGSAELTDGTHYVWPEGLAHYVDQHSVRLPEEITAVMKGHPGPVDPETFERDMTTGLITIDDSWWRTATARRGHGATSDTYSGHR